MRQLHRAKAKNHAKVNKKSMSNPTHSPETWVEIFGDDLYRYALSRLRNKHDAEDVVQETLIAAYKNRDQFTGTGPFPAWLNGILKRKIIDHFRKSNRERTNVENSDADASDGGLEQFFDQGGHWQKTSQANSELRLNSLERSEFASVVSRCLDGLPAKQSRAFVLREMDQQDANLICRILRITESNLWVLLHRARLRMAECVKSHWEM